MHVVGQIIIGPPCSGSHPPFTLHSVTSGPACGGYYYLSSLAVGSDGALWFSTRVADGKGGSYIGRMTTSGKVTFFRTGLFWSTDMVAGPDGAVWFADDTDVIGRISTSGAVTTIGPFHNSAGSLLLPERIAFGPDGSLWFAGMGQYTGVGETMTPGYVAHVTSSGVTEYPLRSGQPASLAFGPDGDLWFSLLGHWAGSGANKRVVPGGIGQMTTSGAMATYGVGSIAANSLAPGPDGAMWFFDGDSFGRITTAGVIATYPYTGAGGPTDLISGPDGAMWFAWSSGAPAWGLGKLATSGQVVASYTSPSIGQPTSLVTGPDGAIWFLNYNSDTVGRLAVP